MKQYERWLLSDNCNIKPKKDSVNKDSSGFIEDFSAALQNDNIIALLGKIFDDKFK